MDVAHLKVLNNKSVEAHMSTTKQQFSESILPIRRDITFNLPADEIHHWHYAAGPVFTTFLNTFSIVLPIGERFFIDSVRFFRDEVTDPQLKEAVRAFIGQEAMHGREHEEYNRALYAKSNIAPKFERLVSRILNFVRDKLPHSMSLSATIALEHFTALLADGVLSDKRVAAGANDQFSALWRWHALEETEHKAVAFDVWETVMGKGIKAYLLRSFGLIAATLIFWFLVAPTFLLILIENGNFFNGKGWRLFFRYTFGKIGLLRKQLLNYVSYFRPGFHPWDHDNSEYLKQIDAFIEEYENLAG